MVIENLIRLLGGKEKRERERKRKVKEESDGKTRQKKWKTVNLIIKALAKIRTV